MSHDSLDNINAIASENMEEKANECKYKINVIMDDVSFDKAGKSHGCNIKNLI